MIMNNLMLLSKSIRGFCFCMGIFFMKWIAQCIFYQWVSIHVPFYHFFISSINNLPILYFFSLTFRYPNNEHENDSTNGQRIDFERVVYAGELGNEKDMEDDDLPLDLVRLVT